MKAPAFQMYAADFYMDTADWTIETVGVYTRLLFFQWINGGLPNDLIKLARIAGCGVKKFHHNWKECSTKFIQNGEGKLQNPRLEDERKKQSIYRNKQALRAESGWVKRNATAKPRQSPRICRNDALQSSSSSSIKNNIIVIPEWIPKETWDGFVEMRKSIKKPLTKKASELIISKLTVFKNKGYNPVTILNNSIEASWQSVYEPKGEDYGQGTGHIRQSYRKPEPGISFELQDGFNKVQAKEREWLAKKAANNSDKQNS